MADAGIYDTLAVKRNAIKMACNAAVTILRVDQVRQLIEDWGLDFSPTPFLQMFVNWSVVFSLFSTTVF